jgi:hypothetical protein
LPKQRRDRKTAQVQEPRASETSNTTTTNTQNKGEYVMGQTLDLTQINDLLSKSRNKGAGEEVLAKFLEDGNPGEVVDLKSGPLMGKSATQAFTTLNNAKNRKRVEGDRVIKVNPQFDAIRVVKRGKPANEEAGTASTEIVALINTSLTGEAANGGDDEG